MVLGVLLPAISTSIKKQPSKAQKFYLFDLDVKSLKQQSPIRQTLSSISYSVEKLQIGK